MALDRKQRLDKLEISDPVIVTKNGKVWEGTIVDVRKHPIQVPDIRVKFTKTGTREWVSGVQVVFEDDA
jgi:hypothetical protein